MNWNRVNIWTNTLYTLIHTLHVAKENKFFNLELLNEEVNNAKAWITPIQNYNSILSEHSDRNKSIRFRRNPNDHFDEITTQLIKMLVQDLVVILDEMMDELIEIKKIKSGGFPQSKVERLRKEVDAKCMWSANGCLELIAARNVLTHNNSTWNEKSIRIVEGFIEPTPKVGEKLIIGIPMLFKYRKAIRTFLNSAGGKNKVSTKSSARGK